MTRRRIWLGIAILSLALPALFFVLLETGLRLAGFGYPTDFWLPVPGRSAMAPNARFGWRFFPPAIARTPEPYLLRAPKPANHFRIFVLGESAAMGFPDPAFSFGRMVEVMLGERYPGVRFEVVNAAMTAINSHAILPIARDCADQQPDLYILYIGNNEVVGPYGPGTVFRAYSPALPLIRAGIWSGSTRVGQLAASLAMRGRDAGQWRGMAMFLDHQVAVDDPRLPAVYANLRRNLVDIARAGRRAGAGVLLATVATNERDSPPFASLHRRDLSPTDRDRWQTRYSAGGALEQAGRFAEALEVYREAAAIDDRYAELAYRMARCELALGRAEAAVHFRAARDLDALRFRADSRINRTIREVAAGLRSEGVVLVDAEAAVPPGAESFYEHVHLNFEGNYRLASAVVHQAESLLPERVRRHAAGSALAAPERVAERLAYTDWDRARLAGTVAAMLSQPPFRQKMAGRVDPPVDLAPSRKAYEHAIERTPEDLLLRQRYAALLAEMQDPRAASQWRFVLERLPGVAFWHQGLAGALAGAGQLQEAEIEYRKALELDPGSALAHLGLGSVYEKKGGLEQAQSEYRAALRLDPDLAEAHNNLALLLSRLGKTAEAIDHFTAALRLRPDSAEIHNNLGLAYGKIGRASDAVREYTEAVRLAPQFGAARYNLAAVLAQSGDLAGSAAQLREALRLNPDSAQTHASLGGVLAAQGKSVEAAAEFRAALRAKPDLEEAHYNFALLLARQGKAGEALEHYQQALRLAPNDSRIHNNLGNLLAQSGRFQEALPHFAEAIRLQPRSIEAHYNFGLALAAARRYAESATEFRAALELKPD
ncbi:MAG TPA: tetratricopeptide repeat protein, partial [Bryobacteraceae bacterium]|nr:tetratricopeptide repeat protein [Bryobacteraceae bacterium]